MYQPEQANAVSLFPPLDPDEQLHVCGMCGGAVPAGERDRHMRFHSVAGGVLKPS